MLANVLHVAELARRYEADGGISFRGFIEELREQAEDGQTSGLSSLKQHCLPGGASRLAALLLPQILPVFSVVTPCHPGAALRNPVLLQRRQATSEAPILEVGSDGVRLMTVHKAKGLEFCVVILADMTAKIHSAPASRYIDSERGACAVRIAGCSPFDLIQHEPEELARDEAEGVRLAYVAATRARDLLVVPAVGDEEREGWIDPINRAIYPLDETSACAG